MTKRSLKPVVESLESLQLMSGVAPHVAHHPIVHHAPAHVQPHQIHHAIKPHQSHGHAKPHGHALSAPKALKALAAPATISTAAVATPAPLPFEAIPGLTQWKADMLKYGAQNAAYLAAHKSDPTVDAALAATYYDAARVFVQIYQFTGDSKWLAAEHDAVTVYRDRYAAANNYAVPGYELFTKGLLDDYQLTGDPASKNAVIQLSLHMYAADSTPLAWTAGVGASRETAYALMATLDAEKLGAPHRARTDALANQALGHIQQWLAFGTAGSPGVPPALYVRPFMVGLTCEALIEYQQATGDARVLPAVKAILDWTWANCWLPASGAFKYTNIVAPDGTGGDYAAPDLNLLIVNSYGWLAQQVGSLTPTGRQYNAEADQIFAGGVKGAYLANGKQFDQNYRSSFDYVSRRLGN